jgi:hypothetical protein
MYVQPEETCRQTISITYNIITIIMLTYVACVPILKPIMRNSVETGFDVAL